jgi:hypothetical protein
MSTDMTKTWFDGTNIVTQKIPEAEIYKRPWVGLTEEERAIFDAANPKTQEEWDALFNGIEAELKEKNT